MSRSLGRQGRNDMGKIISAIDGYKVYILSAIGAVICLLSLAGVDVSSVDPNITKANALQNLWAMAMLASGRSAIKKVQS